MGISQQIVEQIIRPTGLVDPQIVVRPVKGQVDDLIGEIKERTAVGERTLVTTLTKKMAEDLTDYLFEQGIKVRYLHSDIATLERIDILRELRMGTFDVLVGINLLREGLDLPEVSLVAILDADKEGFLRNGRSLIQTIGRAARNVSGQVLMYADRTTDSMQFAIDETNRRRERQVAYNTEHGIEPQTIRKAIADIVQYMHEGESQATTAVEAARELSKLPRTEVLRLITTMEEDMTAAASALDFEAAARLRDQAVKLRAEVEKTSADEVLDRLKAGARKGSEYGRRKRR
jgi:excinuclease ABC subunit B